MRYAPRRTSLARKALRFGRLCYSHQQTSAPVEACAHILVYEAQRLRYRLRKLVVQWNRRRSLVIDGGVCGGRASISICGISAEGITSPRRTTPRSSAVSRDNAKISSMQSRERGALTRDMRVSNSSLVHPSVPRATLNRHHPRTIARFHPWLLLRGRVYFRIHPLSMDAITTVIPAGIAASEAPDNPQSAAAISATSNSYVYVECRY